MAVAAQEIFIGYCRKQWLAAPPQWFEDPRVVRIASVSECMSSRPWDWAKRGDFNTAGLYDTVEVADAAVEGLSRDEYRLFAYTLVPMRFDRFGGEVAVTAESVLGSYFETPPPMARGFRFLGFDPVQRWTEREPGRADSRVLGGGFCCSPLSCNKRARDFDVSADCLIASWDEARRAALDFAKPNGAEPGCYYVFGVYTNEEPTG